MNKYYHQKEFTDDVVAVQNAFAQLETGEITQIYLWSNLIGREVMVTDQEEIRAIREILMSLEADFTAPVSDEQLSPGSIVYNIEVYWSDQKVKFNIPYMLLGEKYSFPVCDLEESTEIAGIIETILQERGKNEFFSPWG